MTKLDKYKSLVEKRDTCAQREISFEAPFYSNAKIPPELRDSYRDAKLEKNATEFLILDLWFEMTENERRSANTW